MDHMQMPGWSNKSCLSGANTFHIRLSSHLQMTSKTYGVSLGANILRQISNILCYVCCISFMITQMTPRKTFYDFLGLRVQVYLVNFQDVYSTATQSSIITFALFPAMASSQRHAVHISSRLTRKSGARALTPAPLFHYFLTLARSC